MNITNTNRWAPQAVSVPMEVNTHRTIRSAAWCGIRLILIGRALRAGRRMLAGTSSTNAVAIAAIEHEAAGHVVQIDYLLTRARSDPEAVGSDLVTEWSAELRSWRTALDEAAGERAGSLRLAIPHLVDTELATPIFQPSQALMNRTCSATQLGRLGRLQTTMVLVAMRSYTLVARRRHISGQISGGELNESLRESREYSRACLSGNRRTGGPFRRLAA